MKNPEILFDLFNTYLVDFKTTKETFINDYENKLIELYDFNSDNLISCEFFLNNIIKAINNYNNNNDKELNKLYERLNYNYFSYNNQLSLWCCKDCNGDKERSFENRFYNDLNITINILKTIKFE